MDDGRCHICRCVPVKQSPLYRLTTCEDCDETAAAHSPPISRTILKLALIGATGLALAALSAAAVTWLLAAPIALPSFPGF